MAATLTIRDGNPWWLSPDIWVVPGSDPTGSPGSPVAGQNAYLWARVGNSGPSDVISARVDFYWANPALQVTRSNATFVGSAYIDVAAGSSQDALCLVPWAPVVVNDGHECLVAVVVSSEDPLPNPLPDAFDPPAFSQVAQRNLTVLEAVTSATVLTLTVAALPRIGKRVLVDTKVGGELEREALRSLGLGAMQPARNEHVRVSLSTVAGCPEEGHDRDRLELELARGSSRPVYVAIRAGELGPDEYQLVHVVEHAAGRDLGGMTFVVVAPRDRRIPKHKSGKEQEGERS